MKILIADDSGTQRALVRNALQQAGVSADDIIEAKDGEEAIARLSEEDQIKILVLDWTMPGKDGMDVLKTLNDEQKLGDTFVVMLTSIAHKGKILEALKCGAKDFIVKPFQPQRVVESIKKVIG